MEDVAQSQPTSGEHYPPGVRPPTAAERKAALLQSPEHKAKRDAALKAYNALPIEEKRRRREEKRAKEIQREAEKLARQTARNGGAPGVAPSGRDVTPDTVRSARGTVIPAPPVTPRRVFVTKARTLLDLMGMFELDGQTFIQVTRTSPKTFQGYSVAGVQRPIWEQLDDAEFAEIYGGEAYDLRVYRISEDGRRPQALSETVSYRVAGPPNPDSAAPEEESPPMHPNRAPAFMRPNGGRGVPHPAVASAEAEMLKTQLGHEETMDERNARREREAEERQERRVRERTEREDGAKLDTARLMADQRREEMERMDRARERELELARESKDNESKLVTELLKSMGAGRGGEESKALLQQHAQEIRQLAEAHRGEIKSISSAHKETLERLTVEHNKVLERAEDNHRQDRKHLEEELRAVDRRSAETIREAQRVADARIADMREENRKLTDDIVRRGEERLKDQKESWERRFEDLKLNHASELRSKDSEINLMRTNLEGNAKVLLDQKDAEIKRLERDLRDAKKEAEDNKDWLGKMSEFEETAEKMGLARPSEKGDDEKDQTVGEIAIKAGMGALQRLPETIAAIGQTIGAVRGQGPTNAAAIQHQRAVAAARPGMRSVPRVAPGHQPPRLAFSTEDSDYVHSPNPHAPSSAPSRPLPPEPLQEFQPAVSSAPQEEPVPALQSVNPNPSVPPEPQPAPMQHAVTQSTPEQQNQAPQTLDPGTVTDEQVLLYMPTLKDMFGSGQPVAAVAAYIVESNGKDNCAKLLQAVSFERITALAAMNPNAGGVQLSTRDGKKFLQGLWAEMTKLVSVPTAAQAPEA